MAQKKRFNIFAEELQKGDEVTFFPQGKDKPFVTVITGSAMLAGMKIFHNADNQWGYITDYGPSPAQ